MAPAMRPFPSSKGWTVTNQRWVRAALRDFAGLRYPVDPLQESGHLIWHSGRLRPFEVDLFPVDGSGDHLYGMDAPGTAR